MPSLSLIQISYTRMPNTCSVYGCKTNYRGHPRATVFRLPKGPPELKDKWITALHRDMSGDLSENNIIICINHFREEDIVRVDRTLQSDGTYTEVPRITPTYRPKAIPVIFQGCPSHLLQLLRLQSVLVENLRKKKTLLKVFMTALFKSNKIVYDSLWIASRILKSSCLICISVQIGRHGTRLVIPYKFYS